jgi:hypothetical protein
MLDCGHDSTGSGRIHLQIPVNTVINLRVTYSFGRDKKFVCIAVLFIVVIAFRIS